MVLLFLTAPLEYMPKAVLSAVVFMIGIQLIDIKGMRSILRVRKDEFVVATLTAATVVLLGVEQGIVLAIVASVIGHLRRSYKTATAVMVPDENDSGLHSTPFDPNARTAPGVAVYRFASDLFYVNANLFLEDLTALANSTEPLEWVVLDSGAITDIDFTGSLTIKQVLGELAEHNVKLVFADSMTSVRHKLKRYGITALVGDDAFYPTVGSALRAVTGTNKGGHQFPDDRP